MYKWRKMSPSQRAETLRMRRQSGQPWHSPPHLDLEGDYIYFVTSACYEHKPIISVASDRMKECESTVLEIVTKTCTDTYAWCIIPNHYHFMARTERFRELRRELGLFHGRSSRTWNLEDVTKGRKVWFNCFERLIRSERHFYTTLNYIHHNPIKHGLVNHWQDWPFSSAREFLGKVGREKAEEIWQQYPILDYGDKWDI
jgi:putative transposase